MRVVTCDICEGAVPEKQKQRSMETNQMLEAISDKFTQGCHPDTCEGCDQELAVKWALLYSCFRKNVRRAVREVYERRHGVERE